MCGVLCNAVRCAVCGVRCAVCGVRCAVCGVRCAVCGVRCAVCGAVRCGEQGKIPHIVTNSCTLRLYVFINVG